MIASVSKLIQKYEYGFWVVNYLLRYKSVKNLLSNMKNLAIKRNKN
jgi:hypothetical protein